MNDTPNMAFKPVVLKTPKGYVCFDYDEIVMFKADGRFSLLYTAHHSQFSSPKRICHSLSFIEKKYCKSLLYRCHREIIINLRHIKVLVIKSREVVLINNLTAKVSVRHFRFLKMLLEN